MKTFLRNNRTKVVTGGLATAAVIICGYAIILLHSTESEVNKTATQVKVIEKNGSNCLPRAGETTPRRPKLCKAGFDQATKLITPEQACKILQKGAGLIVIDGRRIQNVTCAAPNRGGEPGSVPGPQSSGSGGANQAPTHTGDAGSGSGPTGGSGGATGGGGAGGGSHGGPGAGSGGHHGSSGGEGQGGSGEPEPTQPPPSGPPPAESPPAAEQGGGSGEAAPPAAVEEQERNPNSLKVCALKPVLKKCIEAELQL